MKHAIPLPVLLSLLASLLAMPGCTTTVVDNQAQFELMCVGADGAEIARARAAAYAENIELLGERHADGCVEQGRLLKEETMYRARSADALRNPCFSSFERGPYETQYSELANRRAKQAARCGKWMRMCESSIAILENKRKNHLRQAEKHERMFLPGYDRTAAPAK